MGVSGPDRTLINGGRGFVPNTTFKDHSAAGTFSQPMPRVIGREAIADRYGKIVYYTDKRSERIVPPTKGALEAVSGKSN